ncbi:tetratricopeptide repeat protein [Romeria aff. gracilis LEGE 07310]|uniref:non-specific serine/threonine protein kinase n=1 Tax=Vasconcelosia minhoensis LEGE 07310 TaxID=915328 RepID=A0A8J7AB77_9CYAN|nr:serine/threonine-protein kinase [Romeria gracilis]MBE9076394.1 tetratricopeptide repeat protein [Romeria aff. gracilis LEGE 07310]
METTLLGNRYQVIQSLGSGGFGETFLVEDTHMPARPRRVLKRLKPVTDNPKVYEVVQERFQREAAILEKVGSIHHQIPNLFAYFAEGGELYLVQEWVEGQTLTEIVNSGGALPEQRVEEILISLLSVLKFIHAEGIIHRDIKPDNILYQTEQGKPFLIDFGAVKEILGIHLDSQGNTASSIVIGTKGYMPLEQASGRPVFSSDLYSLTMTMIYLLTGKWPQELIDPRNGQVQWRSHTLGVSSRLANVLDKGLQPHPRDRYATAQDMLEALQPSKSTVPETEVSSSGHQTVPKTEVSSSGHQTVPKTEVSSSGYQTVPETEVSSSGNYNDVHRHGQSGFGQSGSSESTGQVVPDEIRGWNWGAFLLSGIWCLPNQVWIGLLSWVPPASFVMPFVLGAKGNEMAWKSRRWKSVDAFKSHQKGWTIAGLVTSGSAFFIFFIIALNGGMPEEPRNQGGTTQRGPTLTSQGNLSAEAVELFNQAVVKQDAGNFRGAIEDYTRYLQLNPEDADAYFNRGNAYLDLNSPVTAIENYTRAIQLDPDYANAYFNQGLAHYDLNNLQAAVESFSRYLQLDSDDADAYFHRANAYDDLGNLQAAIADYTQTIQLDSAYAPAFYNRGLAHVDLGNTSAALDDFDIAAELYIEQGNEEYYYDALDRINELGGFD